jgi:ABC-2 type transport system ATP-binding protein
MLKIENLTKTYANSSIKAVDDISFEVKDGEIVGFLGPNGAGKSTTIKCLTGILPFSDGTITVCGYDIRRNPVDAKKNIAYVADENILYNGLTGLKYINLIADIFGIDENDRKERTEKYAALFDMSDKLGDKIGSYSHGMKQKISIIAGLVHEPKVWVLDEPMTGLDPKGCFELKKLMTEYAAEGNAVLFSSHVLEVVEKLCTKVVIINKGKLVTECGMDELQQRRSDLSLEELFLNLTGVTDSEKL